ncbi:MAG: class I SAM-dependent methyltransferase [Bdellovibrionales bacterium]|nr:class I SAM-dependent methyltransferase [Bdellovibrionales bacterium]
MNLKVIGGALTSDTSEFQQLNNYCELHGLKPTLEWINGQYWLHSDDDKENPITIQIDQELNRHEEFFKRSSIVKELLARAVGVKSGVRPKILDLTGGFLGDTLLFLSFGCEVITVERHPMVARLIQSALANAKHPALSRLTFIPQDAATYLKENPLPDVVFFDPMFEDANEKALPKKEMRIFRSFIGQDQDALSVFNLIRALNPKRLVIKRPRLSASLGMAPSLKIEGKATRYDVYFSS